MTHRLLRLSLLLVAASAAGCSFGSEAAFVGTSSLVMCDDEIPVCNDSAGCKLVEEESHLEGKFPGQRTFIVPTEGEAVIRVKIFWRLRQGPGADTEIIWFEPACFEDYNYESQGADVFAASNAQGIFVQEQRVFRAGDHLVKISSDATAEYLLRTEVLTPSEWEQEQAQIGGLL